MENTIQLPVKRGRFRSLNDMWIRMRRNKLSMVGLTVILLLIIVAIFADQIAPYGFAEQDLANQFAKPSSEHLFGTDDLGRDIFSRVVYGSRISLKVGFISVGIALVLGVAIGAITGYFGGRIDNILMRFIDILQSIPDILLAIAILAALGPGLSNLMIAVGVARPSASGQVITTTVMANNNASSIGRSLKSAQTAKVPAPPIRATSTSQNAARSARR